MLASPVRRWWRPLRSDVTAAGSPSVSSARRRSCSGYERTTRSHPAQQAPRWPASEGAVATIQAMELLQNRALGGGPPPRHFRPSCSSASFIRWRLAIRSSMSVIFAFTRSRTSTRVERGHTRSSKSSWISLSVKPSWAPDDARDGEDEEGVNQEVGLRGSRCDVRGGDRAPRRREAAARVGQPVPGLELSPPSESAAMRVAAEPISARSAAASTAALPA